MYYLPMYTYICTYTKLVLHHLVLLPCAGLNLALGRPSLQSSTLWGYEPGLAVDSDPDTCAFTPRSAELRWWQVHLAGRSGEEEEEDGQPSHTEAVLIESVAVTISPGTYQRFTIFVIGESDWCINSVLILIIQLING